MAQIARRRAVNKKEPARTVPGRSSLRNEPSAKGMALTAGFGSPPHHVPEPWFFGVLKVPLKSSARYRKLRPPSPVPRFVTRRLARAGGSFNIAQGGRKKTLSHCGANAKAAAGLADSISRINGVGGRRHDLAAPFRPGTTVRRRTKLPVPAANFPPACCSSATGAFFSVAPPESKRQGLGRFADSSGRRLRAVLLRRSGWCASCGDSQTGKKP
jgi:hypothetical protein